MKNDPPLIALPRANKSMVEQYVRTAMPTATESEVASRVAEVLMTDALGRAVHEGRHPGGLLDMPKCVRTSSAGIVEEVPYGYENPTAPTDDCDCEMIAGGLVTMMKLQEMQAAQASQIVLPPGKTNHH